MVDHGGLVRPCALEDGLRRWLWVVPISPAGTATLVTGAGTATFRVTVSPFLTSEFGGGSVEITVPAASVETWLDLLDHQPVGLEGGGGLGHRLAGHRWAG